MKKYLLLIIILFTSCGQFKHLKTDNSGYAVFKIDSLNNYYLIYAKQKDSTYKIVSKKEKPLFGYRKVKIGNIYDFTLHSRTSQAPIINGVKMSPINYMDVRCFRFDKETDICKEDGIYDLYSADNLKGIYYKKN